MLEIYDKLSLDQKWVQVSFNQNKIILFINYKKIKKAMPHCKAIILQFGKKKKGKPEEMALDRIA